jgi:hypothetical protein
MGFFKRLINKIDIFGFPLSFEEEESSKVATLGGLIGTFISIGFVISMSVLFGKELIQRKHPFSITSEEHVDFSTVYLKEMPLIFNFITDNGVKIERIDGKNYFEMEIYQYYTYDKITSDKSLIFQKCDYNQYTKHQEWVKKKTENTTIDYLCMTHNNDTKIVNPYGRPNSTFIHISFRKCDSSKRKCAKDLDKVLSDVYIQMLYQDAYIDVNDKENPIKFYENIITSQNNLSFLKRNYISFNNYLLSDDSGWLLEKYNSTEFTVLGDTKIDVNPSIGALKDNLYWITFDSQNIRKKISRSYMKLQDLLAKIGGIVKGSVIIVEIILIFYTRFKYAFYVIKCVLNTEEDYKDLAVEQINIFSVISNKKFNSDQKIVQNSFKHQQQDNIQLIKQNTTSNKSFSQQKLKKVNEKKLNSPEKANLNKETPRKDMDQESLDQKDLSNLKINSIQKNNFINESKNLQEKVSESKINIEKESPIKSYQDQIHSSILVNDVDTKFRKCFKKMMLEIYTLDSYWIYIWSIICFDRQKIKLYEKYKALFSKLISFKKMIKIRSRVNSEFE